MECSYDTLFECDCGGIDALARVKCSGIWEWKGLYMSQFGLIQGMTVGPHAKLKKRIEWIAKCGSAADFSTVTWDDLTNSGHKVFIEIHSIRLFYQVNGNWLWRTEKRKNRLCYYLGQFPFYWDYQFGVPRAATGRHWYYTNIPAPPLPKILEFKPEPPLIKDQPFAMRPSLHTNEYIPMDIYTREDIEFFHGKGALQNIDRQTAWLKQRALDRKKCFLKHYPEQAKKM